MRSKYQFIKFDDKEKLKAYDIADYTRLEYTTEAVELSDLLEEFKYFLSGCGFTINGNLEVINCENVKPAEEL